MSELSRLRMELKTDFELMAIRHGGLARDVEQIGEQIMEQGQQIMEQAKSTARLSREVAEGSRWMEGRLRQIQGRFDAVLGAVEGERFEDHSLLLDLQAQQRNLEFRVERLEQDRPPAA